MENTDHRHVTDPVVVVVVVVVGPPAPAWLPPSTFHMALTPPQG